MKFAVTTLLAVFATTASALTANSVVGRDLLSKATREHRQVAEDGEYDWETAMAWLTGYSVKFQGCNQIKQWNGDVDDKEDVRIQTKRLVRFRLCPSDQCSASKAAGCTSAFGDYVIDMDTFVQSYLEGKLQQQEYDCQYHLLFNCNCDKDQAQDDQFNEEYCQYDCYNEAGLTQCIDGNPYEEGGEGGQQQQFEIQNYMQCNQLKVQNQRALNENEQVKYYVGPYCAGQGGSIKLGLFTDDTCTENATSTSFKDLMGFDLPYSTEEGSLVDAKCLGCIEKNNAEEDYNNAQAAANADDANAAAVDDDQVDADNINEMCENLYTMSGKCESSYPSGMLTSEPNNNACTYMEGIRIVRQDGIIDTGSTRPSAVATSFIVIFAMAFAAMAFYVWYLRTRLGVKKNTLL